MKLLLTSSGFIGNALEKDFLYLVGDRKELKIAIIPTASDPIEWVPETQGSQKYVAKLTGPNNAGKGSDYLYFQSKGYGVVIADLKEDPEVLKKKLEHVDVICVPGGDPNYLVDWAKKAHLGAYLRSLLERGVVYLGASAGSQLVLPDFGLTWWDPIKWEGEDHAGLGIVDFVLVPHQKESDPEKKMEALVARKKYLQSMIDFPWGVYLLQDGQAIKVDGDNVEHLGPGVKKFI
jgi:peptidase E